MSTTFHARNADAYQQFMGRWSRRLARKFIAFAGLADGEMCRVVRPGGTVAATVWDTFGGMPNQRMFWDTAAMLDPAAGVARGRSYFRPMTKANQMKETWTRLGLLRVEETALMIRMEFADFGDFWDPIAAGEAVLGQYVAGISHDARQRLEQAL